MHENTEFRREVNTYCGVENRHHTKPARFVVIPAGIGFFHITEYTTGRVKGFRREHIDACALARDLER